MIAQRALIQLFEQILKKKMPVRLLNTYRGVPVAHEARLVSVHKGYVVVDLHPEQATCLGLENKTYIQAELLPEVIQAQVAAIDLAKNQAVWSQLGYERRSPNALGVQAWQDAAAESMPGAGALFFKQLRLDRVLRPI